MTEIEKELQEKKSKLAELIRSRSDANCASKYSSEQDVQRETEVEDLEDEIKALEKKIRVT